MSRMAGARALGDPILCVVSPSIARRRVGSRLLPLIDLRHWGLGPQRRRREPLQNRPVRKRRPLLQQVDGFEGRFPIAVLVHVHNLAVRQRVHVRFVHSTGIPLARPRPPPDHRTTT